MSLSFKREFLNFSILDHGGSESLAIHNLPEKSEALRPFLLRSKNFLNKMKTCISFLLPFFGKYSRTQDLSDFLTRPIQMR